MSVGYSVHYANYVYRILNLDTKSIIQSCDIIWLNKEYHDWIERKFSQTKKIDDEYDDIIANSMIQVVKIFQDNLRSA
jgi:hypothetical protein